MEINTKVVGDELIIIVPIDIIYTAATQHPEGEIVVYDKVKFAECVAEHLNGIMYDQETGLTAVEQLIDDAIIAVSESGDECCDVAE